MEIKVNELEVVLNKVLEYLKFQELNAYKIEGNNYLIIGSDDWNDFASAEIKPDVGSLKDDWESLKKNIIVEEIVTPVDLDRLSSILRAISQQISPV